MKKRHLKTIAASALTASATLALAAVPALAVGLDPVRVPEPTTLGLLAAGAVCGAIALRFRKRK